MEVQQAENFQGPVNLDEAVVIIDPRLNQDGGGDEDKQMLLLLRKQLAPGRDRVYSPEVRSLAENLAEMIPNTPLSYLLHRCEDLVDKSAAIERFTEELLTNPNPPPHWGQELQAGPSNVAEGETQAVAGTSSGSTATTPKKAQNPLEVWEGQCMDQLKSMFPYVCPDHLLTCVQRITEAKEGVGEEVTGADHSKFQQLVENLWNPPQPLPTMKEYEARKKEQMELEN